MKKFYLLFATLIVFQSLCFVGMTYLYVNSDYNRYDLKQISDYRRDQFLIDKKTGRVWQLVVDNNNNNLFSEVPKIWHVSKKKSKDFFEQFGGRALSDKELLDLANERMK